MAVGKAWPSGRHSYFLIDTFSAFEEFAPLPVVLRGRNTELSTVRGDRLGRAEESWEIKVDKWCHHQSRASAPSASLRTPYSGPVEGPPVPGPGTRTSDGTEFSVKVC